MDEKHVVEVVTKPPVIVAAPAPLRVKVRLADPANYGKATRDPCGIVLHATDGCEGPTKDDDEAAAISKPLVDKKSFHYVVDSDSCTRCVPDLLTAWHARPHGNKWGIGIEICGRANQTRAQWLDPVSLATLSIAARLVADLCREHKFPAVLVDADGLKLGKRGITTHALVAAAWRESDHWDPGPGFPLEDFLEAVRQALEAV